MAKSDYKSDDQRLCCVADTARNVMQFFIEERTRCVRHLAGDRYSSNAASRKTYINLIGLFVNIVGRQLISQNPRFMLSTRDQSQRPVVDACETWINDELVRTNFADTFKRIVYDAMFSIGIPKIALATPAESETMAWGVDAGMPFISQVSLDDFVYDYRARNFDEVRFIGHRYRMPKEMAMDNPRFNKKARENLDTSTNIAYSREGSERTSSIGHGHNYGYDEDLVDMVDLWELYLPQERVVKTFTENDLTGPSSAWEGNKPVPLGEQRWIGPDSGPYPILGFFFLPDNIFPIGPVLPLVNLHEHANINFRKLARQAERLKKNTVCDSSDPQFGSALTKAFDGQAVPTNGVSTVQEIVQGGPDPNLTQWNRIVTDAFMLHGGNLLTMGGLAPQAGTLGQEELLAQQSNGQVASMYDSAAACACKCADSMLWYYWNHPTLRMQTTYTKIPGRELERTIQPWSHPDPDSLRRTGPKPSVKIDFYSMRRSSPQQHVKDIMGFIRELIPIMPILVQQGKVPNIDALVEIVSKRIDVPDLARLFNTQEPMASDENSPAGRPTPTQQTVRRFASSGSAREQNMEQDNAIAMMAAAGNNGQMMNGRP